MKIDLTDAQVIKFTKDDDTQVETLVKANVKRVSGMFLDTTTATDNIIGVDMGNGASAADKIQNRSMRPKYMTVVIEMLDNDEVKFDVQDVTNQILWTPVSQVGLDIAISAISASL